MPRFFRAALLAASILASRGTAGAAGDAAPGTPAASPSPSASDPCGGDGRLLATLDRPTVGFSVCAVPPGAVVLEDGYQITTQGGAAALVNAQIGQGFQRVGVADRFELDLIGPNYVRTRTGGSVGTGYSDLGLGFKYEFKPRSRFTYAVDGLFTAASGTNYFGFGLPSQTIDVDVSYPLSPVFSLGTTLAGQYAAGYDAAGTARRYGSFVPSFVVAAQIPNYYQFYAEYVGATKIAPDAGGRSFIDFGLQKLLGRNFELDVEEGLDFTPVAGSRFLYTGAGFGLRL